MKGPAERLKYDLRRLWECPVCRHRERTGGDAVSHLCGCQEAVEPAKRQWMKLIEDGVRRNPEPKPVAVKPIHGEVMESPPAAEEPIAEPQAEAAPPASTPPVEPPPESKPQG